MEHKVCPECGTELEDITYTVAPPIEEWRCPKCGRRYDKRKTIHMSAAIEKVISERERQMEPRWCGVTDMTQRLQAARERGGLGYSMSVMLRQAEQLIIDLFQIHQLDKAEITRLRRMIEAKEG